MGGPGSGRRPKIYDDAIVVAVRKGYADGKTQSELAKELSITQKVVWNLMRRHGITARIAAKRDQRGEKNSSWKGHDASYKAMHLRVRSIRGEPTVCSACGRGAADWASISKDYANPFDYVSLCRSCHSKMDDTVKNLGPYAKKRKESPDVA